MRFHREVGTDRERVARQAPVAMLIVLFLTSLVTFGACPRAQARMRAPEPRSAVSQRKGPPARTVAFKLNATCPVSSGLSAAHMPRTVAPLSERPVALLSLSSLTPAPVFGAARVLRTGRERVHFPRARSAGEPGRPREP